MRIRILDIRKQNRIFGSVRCRLKRGLRQSCGQLVCNMLNNFRNLQSLFWSHGSRWLLFRVGYALRKRTGYIRLQMPAYQWKDRPLGTWLKKNIPATPVAYTQWRKQDSPKFFFDPPHLMLSDNEASLTRGVENLRSRSGYHGHIPWNPKTAVDDAERILSGELKYFSHTYYQV